MVRAVWIGVGVLCLAGCEVEFGSSSDGWPEPCGRVGHPDFTGPGAGVIGPGGGVVQQTDPEHPLAGVRVEVAAGAWDDCWEVAIGYESVFDTPDYPDGYVPFERPYPSGAIDVRIGLTTESDHRFHRAPDPLPFELSFPLAGLPEQTGEIHAAFRYDETARSWRIVFSNAMDPDRLRVATTRHDELWSWGKIDLAEIDSEAHLAPAMEEYLGTETYQELRAKLDEIQREVIVEQNMRTCVGLELAQNVARAFRAEAERLVDAMQRDIHGCGTCDALSTEFFEGIVDYVTLNIEAFFAEMIFDAIPARAWPLKLAAGAMWLTYEAMILSLPCDYECYFDEANPVLYLGIAAYWTTHAVVDVIERYQRFLRCPGTTAVIVPLD